MMSYSFLFSQQALVTSLVGDVFELTTLGHEGRVTCFVNFSTDSNLEVEIRGSISHFTVTGKYHMSGNTLIVNIAINPQGLGIYGRVGRQGMVGIQGKGCYFHQGHYSGVDCYYEPLPVQYRNPTSIITAQHEERGVAGRGMASGQRQDPCLGLTPICTFKQIYSYPYYPSSPLPSVKEGSSPSCSVAVVRS